MTLGELAAVLKCGFDGAADTDILGAAPMETAGPGDISFVRDARAGRAMKDCGATALIVPENIKPDRPALIAGNPYHAFAQVMGILYPEPPVAPGVSDKSEIGEGVILGEGVRIGPFATVGDGARIGDGADIRAGARIGAGCVVGEGSVISENVVVYENCEIGARCRIHANTVIGADGFGYVPLGTGEYYKVPQRGIVRLEDDVEIGAGSSVDRATLGVTLIKKGVKLDNQVQIGHNCEIGENTVIAGCTGVAGSTAIGSNVAIGGMVAISDHINIASGVLIAGKTGVHTDLKEPGVYAGPMAMKNTAYKRFLLVGRTVEKLKSRIEEIEKKFRSGESGGAK